MLDFISMELCKMKVAVLSGKGGTGKTFAAVNLAAVARSALYVDCDVEEPNGHLFFKPENINEETVSVPVPVVDAELCTGCRTCVSFCKYNALAFVGGKVKVFNEVCHACGGCVLLCPAKAFFEQPRTIGLIRRGESGSVSVCTGLLHTGEASGVPVIKALLERIEADSENVESENMVIIDCPPGSACVVMESIKEADFCLLVAEPTVFGVQNLRMVHELVSLFQKPHAVLLNKCLPDGRNPSEDFCHENNVPILGTIPYTQDLAAMNADAKIVARETEAYHKMFSDLLSRIQQQGRLT